MNAEIESSDRRLVVIIDPHIKKSQDYFVHENGMDLHNAPVQVGNFTSIFMRTPSHDTYVGDCWPSDSVWIDFYNENA